MMSGWLATALVTGVAAVTPSRMRSESASPEEFRRVKFTGQVIACGAGDHPPQCCVFRASRVAVRSPL